jgi:glutamate--cysteine ligase
LWTGLLYDDTALDAAAELVRGWTVEEIRWLRREVPRTALATPFRGRTVRDIAREVVAIAKDGLQRRARIDWDGGDETRYLVRLEGIAAAGRTPAEEKLERYEGEWGRRVEPVFRDYAF